MSCALDEEMSDEDDKLLGVLRNEYQDITLEEVREFKKYERENRRLDEADARREARRKPKPKPKAQPKEAREAKDADTELSWLSESLYWAQRAKSLRDQENNIDLELRMFLNVLKKRESPRKRKAYSGLSSEKDPYPPVPGKSHGYIRPPKLVGRSKSTRNPIYKNEVCYPPPDFVEWRRKCEEGRQGWIPGPERRRDRLRWRLREKYMYSHPDYHQVEKRRLRIDSIPASHWSNKDV
jgi:hypothetical protein